MSRENVRNILLKIRFYKFYCHSEPRRARRIHVEDSQNDQILMKKKIDAFFSWPVFGTLGVLFYAVKYLSPLAIGHWFNGGAKGLLNALSFSAANQSLNFYTGKLEELYLGPLAMLLGGCAFLILCKKILVESSFKIFAAATFVFILLTRLEILFWPPYGDSASGPFIEALWLLHNNFDYVKLSQQPGFVAGGPKVYLFSIYPTFMALLKSIIPHHKTFFLVNHLLGFTLGAGVVALLRQIMQKVTTKENAILVALCLLYLPLFQSQVEQINMEMPVTFFAILSLYYLIEKKLARASLMSMLAVLAKGVAVYISVTVFVAAIFLVLTDEKLKNKWTAVLWGSAALLFAALNYYGSFYILNAGGNVKMVGAFEGIRWMKSMPLFYVFIISTIVLFWDFIEREYDEKENLFAGIIQYLKQHYVAFVMYVSAGGWFFLFLNSYGGQYRYRLILAPAIVFCVYYMIHLRTKVQKVKSILIYFCIFFSLLFSYGLIYGNLFDVAYSTLERSLEYRNDMKLDLKVAKALNKTAPDFLIAAPFTMAQILALPELGYVTQKLNVMIYGYPARYGGIKNFNGLQELNIEKTIWIALDDPANKRVDYPVGPNDRVIGQIEAGERRAKLFLGGFAIEQMRIDIYKRLMARKLQFKSN